jgi:hypothetical protein
VADRIFLPTADGGRAITDAVIESYHVVNIGRALAGALPLAPKGGARFHFELPGSVQGFLADDGVDSRGTLEIANASGHSLHGTRSLALRCRGLAPGRVARATTATFTPPEAIRMAGYSLYASPTLYPGQTLRAALSADTANASALVCRLILRRYGPDDQLVTLVGPEVALAAGEGRELAWPVPDTGGQPIAAAGLEIAGAPHGAGTIYLDYLTWDGAPDVALRRPDDGGGMWLRAWVDGVDLYEPRPDETYRLIQNAGVGLITQGTRDWADYVVSAAVMPHLAQACGIGARAQGMTRYVALTLGRDGAGRAALRLRARVEEDEAGVEAPFAWEVGRAYRLRLEVRGREARAWADGALVLTLGDIPAALDGGGAALLCEEGHAVFEDVEVRPPGER